MGSQGIRFQAPGLIYSGQFGLLCNTLPHILAEHGNAYLVNNMVKAIPHQASMEVFIPAPELEEDEIDYDVVPTIYGGGGHCDLGFAVLPSRSQARPAALHCLQGP